MDARYLRSFEPVLIIVAFIISEIVGKNSVIPQSRGEWRRRGESSMAID